MTIPEKILKLRQLMKEKHIDIYLVPSADNHQSEYVGDHFKCREFITGFTGSAGTAIITQSEAGLWTDGRYFLQAEKELSGSGIVLFKMGQPGVPTIEEYIDIHLPQNGTLGFDGRVISMAEGKKYRKRYQYKNIQLEDQFDLVDSLWEDRPSMSEHAVFLLDEAYSGESTKSKLSRIRKEMKKNGATAHIMTTLDDISWLLNMRGRDVLYVPVSLCYAIVMLDCVHLFIEEKKLSDDIKETFAAAEIILHPYDEVYTFTAKFSAEQVVLIDPNRLNFMLYNIIPTNVKVVEKTTPAILLKCIKNQIEIANIREAHIKDAIAHTKFMYWVKTHFQSEEITELSASEKLESLRAQQEHFLCPSFAPICAFGPHAAMCHYSSSKETNVVLREGELFLTDTGGHYLEGSTDITRTIALGKISDELKQDFTNVLRGNLALSRSVFLYGCTGQNLDILARQFLWNERKDFNHGTGHGVGYLLSIHEPSCRFNWRAMEETQRPLAEGQVITDEPGIYIENSHGIRLENELLVQKDDCNSYGQFMKFEVLTLVPFDLDAIDSSLLEEVERKQLNAYHKRVYETLAPHLTSEERKWLQTYTRPL